MANPNLNMTLTERYTNFSFKQYHFFLNFCKRSLDKDLYLQLQEKRFNKNAKRPPTRIFKGITDERRHSYYVIYATCTNKYAHAAAQQLWDL